METKLKATGRYYAKPVHIEKNSRRVHPNLVVDAVLKTIDGMEDVEREMTDGLILHFIHKYSVVGTIEYCMNAGIGVCGMVSLLSEVRAKIKEEPYKNIDGIVCKELFPHGRPENLYSVEKIIEMVCTALDISEEELKTQRFRPVVQNAADYTAYMVWKYSSTTLSNFRKYFDVSLSAITSWKNAVLHRVNMEDDDTLEIIDWMLELLEVDEVMLK